ncbi:hypothetical protein [Actinoplanes solisilvae]|uniref:hypothetical protein n=1 Tax=Actinoplanes solisilvae TaxID=2486853 RepID=UPI000FD9A3BA|nr:hypothetical protein [Actinoplanes solisilvae]
MERTDLIVPAEVVPRLVIPPLAITTGAEDPEWVEVPLGRWRFQRTPSLRLPMDSASAKAVRRWMRYAPWSPVPIVVALGAWVVGSLVDLSGAAFQVLLVVVAATAVSSLLRGQGLPDQTPDRSRSGDLRVPRVPLTVAMDWVAGNPGVSISDDPAPRPYSRRFSTTWAVALLVAAIGLGWTLTADHRENPVLLWQLDIALFVGGLVMAYKIQPPAAGTD